MACFACEWECRVLLKSNADKVLARDSDQKMHDGLAGRPVRFWNRTVLGTTLIALGL